MSQMSQAIYQLRAQAILDHVWMSEAEQAIAQHAEAIDVGKLHHVKMNILRNDVVKTANDVEANDQTVKAVILDQAENTRA